jgi:hypothetical protein
MDVSSLVPYIGRSDTPSNNSDQISFLLLSRLPRRETSYRTAVAVLSNRRKTTKFQPTAGASTFCRIEKFNLQQHVSDAQPLEILHCRG